MNVIAPVFTPGAQITPAVEEQVGRLMLKMFGRNIESAEGLTRKLSWREQAAIERRQDIIQLHADGLDVQEMCEELGISESTARGDLMRLGLTSHPSKAKERQAEERKRIHQERLAFIADNFHLTKSDIARHLGLSRSRVDSLCAEVTKADRQKLLEARA